MTDIEWKYHLSKEYWESSEKLRIEFQGEVKDVEAVASQLRSFLETQTLPFKILGKMQIRFSDKKANDKLEEYWSQAYVVIPIVKRTFSFLHKNEILNSKHFLKVQINSNSNKIASWQESDWQEACRWYLTMEQIKAWKGILEKFASTFIEKKISEIGNPSTR